MWTRSKPVTVLFLFGSTLQAGCPLPIPGPTSDTPTVISDSGSQPPTGDTGDTTSPTDTSDSAVTADSGGTTDPLPCSLVVAQATELGAVPLVPGTTGANGGFAVQVNGAEAWVWSDLVLDVADADGGNIRSGSWTTDATGDPIAWSEGSADELLADDGSCGPAVVFGGGQWSSPYLPRAAAANGSSAILAYTKSCTDAVGGVGFADWTTASGPAVLRTSPGPDPTVTFATGEAFAPLAALWVEGEDLFAWDCRAGFGVFACTVGRAPIASAADPAAWEVWDGTAWATDRATAATVFNGGMQMSVHYSEFLSQYVAVYGSWATPEVFARTAPAPEGPWSDPVLLFAPTASDTGAWDLVLSANVHTSLAEDGGRVEYVSHSANAETRLVAVELDCGPN